jgi:hypothetical protein
MDVAPISRLRVLSSVVSSDQECLCVCKEVRWAALSQSLHLAIFDAMRHKRAEEERNEGATHK